jgi:hypothetical protein
MNAANGSGRASSGANLDDRTRRPTLAFAFDRGAWRAEEQTNAACRACLRVRRPVGCRDNGLGIEQATEFRARPTAASATSPGVIPAHRRQART